MYPLALVLFKIKRIQWRQKGHLTPQDLGSLVLGKYLKENLLYSDIKKGRSRNLFTLIGIGSYCINMSFMMIHHCMYLE